MGAIIPFFSSGQARKMDIAVVWQAITEFSRGAYDTREVYIFSAFGRGVSKARVCSCLSPSFPPKVAVSGGTATESPLLLSR